MTVSAPIILDMGKTKRRRVRQLKRGRGRLLDDVQDAVQQVSAEMGEQANGKQLVPVVLIYRKKRKRGRGGNLFFPFL